MKHIIPVILLILITTVLFANTLKNSFVWDDRDLVVENIYIRSARYIPFLLSPSYWKRQEVETSGQYRPIRSLSFVFDYGLWKLNPAGYHLTNLLLHIVNVILVYFLMNYLWQPRRLPPLPLATYEVAKGNMLLNLPFLTALFFAIHPAHVESIAWIKSRQDLFASIFFLSALFLFINYIKEEVSRRRAIFYFAACISFILALLSKEAAVIFPFVLVLYALCFSMKPDYKKIMVRVLPFFAIVVLYFLFKANVLGRLVSMGHGHKIGLYPNILTVFMTLGYYIKILVFPFDLNVEHAFLVPGSLFEVPVFFSVILLLVCLVAAIKTFKESRLAFFAMLWIFITLAPVSNIIFLSARPIAEQRLYIPSLGFCIILAMAVTALSRVRLKFMPNAMVKYFPALVFMPLFYFYSVGVVERNLDWRNELTLWSRTVHSSPNSTRAHNNLGKAYSDIGRHEEAIGLYKKALELYPAHANAYYNLGRAYSDLGDPDRAIESYKKVIEIRPDYASAYNNIATEYKQLGMLQESEDFYNKALEVDPEYERGHYNLANLCVDRGEFSEAIKLYRRAMDINPWNVAIYNNLAKVYTDLGVHEEAAALYKEAIRLNPDDADVYYNIAEEYRKLGRYEDAAYEYDRILKVNPRYVDLYYNLGNSYSHLGRFEEAIESYIKAIEINPAYIDGYNNLGNVYSDIGKYEQALGCYRKALELDRGYAITYANLCVNHFRQKRYKLAIKYLDKATRLGFSDQELSATLQPYRD